jgi:hypothetical protein
MLAAIFIERYAILAILFILSPLAFVFYVFSKNLFSKWWSYFIKWCFIGLIGAFFLNLSLQVFEAIEKDFIGIGNAGPLGAEPILAGLGQISFYVLIFIVFLLVGVYLTFKASGWASGMAIAGGIWVGKAVASLAGKGMNKLAERPVFSRAEGARSIKDAFYGAKDSVTRGLESMRLMRRGTTGSNQAQRYQAELNDKDRISRVENMTADERVQELRRNRQGRAGRLDRAAIIKQMGQDGQLGILGQGDQTRYVEEGLRYGVKSDIVGKMSVATQAHVIQNNLLNPEARSKIIKALADKKQLDSLDLVTDTIDQNRQRKIRAILEAQEHGVLPQDIVNKMNSDDQAHIINTDQFNAETRGKAVESLMKKKDLDLISGPRRQRAFTEAVQSGVGPEEMEAADYHYAIYNNARIRRLATTAERAAIDAGGPVPATLQERAREQVLNANISKMDGDQLRNIDTIDLFDATVAPFDPTNAATHNTTAYKRVEKLKTESIKEFQYDANPRHRQALKMHIPQLRHSIQENEENARNARRAGNQAEATHYTNEAIRLGSILKSIDNLP